MINSYSNSKSEKYTYKENILRQKEYQKDEKQEKFLDHLNYNLQGLEPDLKLSLIKPLPLIFVIGLHRTGATLLTQVMAYCADIGYINNLIARFWLAPVTGIRLSKILLGKKKCISFTSNYGKTAGITEPHEFSYFWHYWFKMDNIPPYYPNQIRSKIDWEKFKITLRNMAAEFNKPLMMKASDVGYHIKKVEEIFPEALFVLMQRDLADIAVSLYNGRMRYYGNVDIWLGSYPVEIEKIKDFRGMAQIARQVYYLDKMYKDGFNEISGNKRITIKLEELCSNPKDVVEQIFDRVSENNDHSINCSIKKFEGFHFSTYRGSDGYKQAREILSELKVRENT